jgi:Arc/MetJ family transcription regulator
MVAGGALTAESVSEYGLKNGREMVAEMFVDYLGGTLDATRPELRRVIDAMGWEE